jgi:23S rRNA (pseudouridine1915-N3)-methyltransferase
VIRRATIVAVGKLKGWAVEGCDDYLSRLRRYFPVEVVEVPEGDMNRRTTEEVLAAEGERLLKRIPAGAHVVALDRGRGKPLSSEELARRLDVPGVSGRSHVAFVTPLIRIDNPAARAGEGGSLGAALPWSQDRAQREVPLVGCKPVSLWEGKAEVLTTSEKR